MSNRRVDVIFFGLLLAVSVIGYYAANRSSELSAEGSSLVLPDFSPSPLLLEIPFDFPYAIVKFKSLPAPKLDLSDDMEAALSEVRSALLESSTLVEVRAMGQQIVAAE